MKLKKKTAIRVIKTIDIIWRILAAISGFMLMFFISIVDSDSYIPIIGILINIGFLTLTAWAYGLFDDDYD